VSALSTADDEVAIGPGGHDLYRITPG